MKYEEYIKIKNLINLCDFYGENINRKDGSGLDMWASRSLLLINVMCELSHEDKFPKSASLEDLIVFGSKYPEAKKLNEYIKMLPGFDPTLGHNQTNSTLTQHGFVQMGLSQIGEKKEHEVNKKCTLNLSGTYIIRQDLTGLYLDVHCNNRIINVEKRTEFREKSFRINGTLVDDLDFCDLINCITYAYEVKVLNKNNINAAYYFLR